MAGADHAILVVDDEPGVQGLLRSVLERDGFEVHVAASAEEAVQIFHDVELDAVLADVVMPGMDGFELLEELLRIDAGIPVLLMTGYGSIDAAVDAMRRGATDYITKPFKRRRLISALERALSLRKAEPGPVPRIEDSALDSALEQRLTLRELGDLYIERALSAAHGNKVQAARALGINRRTLYRRSHRVSEREN
jgi:DNA-binding NtrC family response regulator